MSNDVGDDQLPVPYSIDLDDIQVALRLQEHAAAAMIHWKRDASYQR
jgi:hypothetical protein